MRAVVLLFAVILSFSTWSAKLGFAQSTADAGQWLALFAQGDLETQVIDSPRLKWWFDGHLRYLDDAGGYNQTIFRPGIGVPVTEKATLWAGYGWIHTSPVSGPDFQEHRTWQQSTWSDTQNQWTLALRSRLEQRFVETGDDVGWRFRQLVRVQHDLPRFSRLTLVVWDEAFFALNDTDWGAASGFDQNRAFGGFGWKPNPDGPWRVEIGYLNHAIDMPSGNDRTHHLLSVNFFR